MNLSHGLVLVSYVLLSVGCWPRIFVCWPSLIFGFVVVMVWCGGISFGLGWQHGTFFLVASVQERAVSAMRG